MGEQKDSAVASQRSRDLTCMSRRTPFLERQHQVSGDESFSEILEPRVAESEFELRRVSPPPAGLEDPCMVCSPG